jgi:hypothetical protein
MRRIALFVVLVLLTIVSAHAQVALYVTSSSDHLSSIATGSVYTSTSGSYQEQYASYWTSGIGGGVTLNFLPLGPVKLGFDFRGSTHPGTVGADTGMAGVRLGFNPPLIHLKPYIQASGGYVGTRTVNVSSSSTSPSQTVGGTFNNKYVAWEIVGGIDYPLIKFVDVRVIELGGGTGVSIPGSSSAPNISLFTVSTGVVLHF